MSDALADLGLDLVGTSVTEEAAASAEAATEAKKPRAPRVEVEVGEILVSEGEELTGITRGRSKEGTKYPFDTLAAPTAKTDGTDGYLYAAFTVELQDGVEFENLQRSVQSANTQANAAAKKEGSGKYFVTRTLAKEGKNVGMKVFRVDNTLD